VPIGSGDVPSAGWWKEFTEDRASAPHTASFPRVPTPKLEMQIHGVDVSSDVYRAYRQWWGHFKACYERSLADRAETTRQGSDGPQMVRYWVARVRQNRSRICVVQVVETTVTDEVSACFESELLRLPENGGESGTLEVALAFREQ